MKSTIKHNVHFRFCCRVNVEAMGECEVCGAMKVNTREVSMGKAPVRACLRCVEKLGLAPNQSTARIRTDRSLRSNNPKSRKRNDIMAKQEKELVRDFAMRINKGRTLKGWTHAELGKRMAETVNVIKSAESGKPPTDSVIRKLERVLGIELMVSPEFEETKRLVSNDNRGMTLGDFFKQSGG